jgi:hypothetical protein
MTTPTENEHTTTPTVTPLTAASARPGPDLGDGTALQPNDLATMPAAGGTVVILAANSVATGEIREVVRLVAERGGRPGFQTIDGEYFYLDELGAEWRLPTESEAAPYRCPVIVDHAGERVGCGAVLGRNRIDCVVCHGRRCFAHCGSIDHFPGKQMSRGGIGPIEWRTREIDSRFFMGQLYRRSGDGDELVIVETVGGVQGESHRDMFRRVEALLRAFTGGER